ncbi:NUDIX hydrolase [Pseudogemmobacter humi]|uniref:Diadenosine hexaphosphate hydrolase n=1 Tax=Pseudogemmobacter humi TaxID=2483812 RepID=A0A3P5XAT8_9RHOB|nr:NUDIX hydrolase [Pseudogemmobacter humi]VDC31662.1 Diadenosine hexaphosphate hydrolase [Pseudogemmobacter humi]
MNNQVRISASGDEASGRQFAALCWRADSTGGRQILLITSRDTGRWILPKGWPMKGLSPSEAAAQEAWEEAGVTGEAEPEAFGRYSYDKLLRRADALPCEVQVFPLQVQGLAGNFPERRQRRRKWFSPEKAARKVAEPELRDLILAFAAAPGGENDPQD